MTQLNTYLEDLVRQSGGMSRFQIIMVTITLGSQIGPIWGMMMMTFAGYVPDWKCKYELPDILGNTTSYSNESYEMCQPPSLSNTSTCSAIIYDEGIRTTVTEV